MKIVHLVLGLGKGGAERMLVNILRYRTSEARLHDIEVVSLGLTTYYEQTIRSLGIPVYLYKLRVNPIKSILRVRRHLKDADTVSSWLYGGNLLAWVATLGCKIRLIWNIRHGDLSFRYNKTTTILTARAGAFLTRRVSRVAYNGENSRSLHEDVGYPQKKGIVLVNGCDTSVFRPTNVTTLHTELALCPEAPIVLSVARWHPLKDHATFLTAFAEIRRKKPEAVALLSGEGVTNANSSLMEMVRRHRLEASVRILGQRDDLPELFSLADVYILHSAGEAFPNTLIEAMACAAPVVATNVGDVRAILPPDMMPIEPGDAHGLASAALEILEESDEDNFDRRRSLRDAILARYSIKNVVVFYEKVLGIR